MDEIGAFFRQLNAWMKRFILGVIRKSGPRTAGDPLAAVGWDPGDGHIPEDNLVPGINQKAQTQPCYFEYHWSKESSLVVRTRVVEADPPAGYLKTIQVLRTQIRASD